MLMRVIYLVYKWCWIISSDLHRQYAFGEHSPAIFLFIIAMHDKHLVHETATLSILDSNVDCESHAIIDSPPHNHRHTTGTVPQHCQCFDCIRYAAPNKDGDPLLAKCVSLTTWQFSIFISLFDLRFIQFFSRTSFRRIHTEIFHYMFESNRQYMFTA